MLQYVDLAQFLVVLSASILALLVLRSIRDHIAGGLWQLHDSIGKMREAGELPEDAERRFQTLDSKISDLTALTERRYKTLTQVESRRIRREKVEAGGDDELDPETVEKSPEQLDFTDAKPDLGRSEVFPVGHRPRLRRIEP